jgi:hypothetical protein
MTDDEMIEWIHTASYEDLLRKQRFEPIGCPWFCHGRVSQAFGERFKELFLATSMEDRVEASKRVGWESR